MKKMIISTLAIVLFAISAQAQRIDCELLTIKNTSKEVSEESYQQKMVSVTMVNQDGENEGKTQINADTDLTITEDTNLKGLFSLMLVGGSSPVQSDDGIILTALLKKDYVINNEELRDGFIQSLTIKNGETAQSFALLRGDNLSPVTQVSLINKLSKLLRAHNQTATTANRFNFSRQMMVQEGMSLIAQPVVEEIIKKNFQEGETLMIGISGLCIEGKDLK